jgi:glycosyltransferase involved in cell wall biosynthesis
MNQYSVIIPTLIYKYERLISLLRILDSIIDNSSEIIIVFQGENLNYLNLLCKEFKKSVFKFIVSEEIGISVARNIGIYQSTKEWIIFLDDDIYINNDFFVQLNTNINKSYKAFYGNVLIEETNNNFVKYYITNKNINFFSYNRICSVSLVLNRSIFNEIGFFDERLGTGSYFGSSEESDLIIRMLMHKIVIKYLKTHTVWHPFEPFPHNKYFKYGKGLGALYKKYLFNSPIILKLKLIFDLLLRFFLLLTFSPKRYFFLLGALRGFIKFK